VLARLQLQSKCVLCSAIRHHRDIAQSSRTADYVVDCCFVVAPRKRLTTYRPHHQWFPPKS